MRRITAVLALALSLIFGVYGQGDQEKPNVKPASASSQDSAPTLDQILDKYIQALGGKAAIESITSRVMKGEVQEPIDTWSYEAYWKAPNKYLQIIRSTGDTGLTKFGTNGAIVWTQDNDGNVQELKMGAARSGRDADLYGDLKLKQYYPNMTLKGKKQIGGREAYWIESKTPEGLSDEWYFDVKSGLLIGHDYEIKLRDRKVSVQFRYEDHRKIDSVMVPFTINRLNPSPYTHRWKEVRNNIPLDDAIFDKPAAK